MVTRNLEGGGALIVRVKATRGRVRTAGHDDGIVGLCDVECGLEGAEGVIKRRAIAARGIGIDVEDRTLVRK